MRARWLFFFFLVSGFCGLVYEIVWLRLAMAAFGVTTPLVSIVLSVFMAGLALGGWGGGRLTRALRDPSGRLTLRLYALSELIIGLSAVIVPAVLSGGRSLLAGMAEEAAWGSASHHAACAVFVAAALLPFCAAMGATFPLAMAALVGHAGEEARRVAFGRLYLANVMGAAAGTIGAAVLLVELLGFHRTLLAASCLNLLLAAAAFTLSRAGSDVSRGDAAGKDAARRDAAVENGVRTPRGHGSAAGPGRDAAPSLARGAPAEATPPPAGIPWMLFTTGLVSMAMEVVWVRQFTPSLGTVVYAFAAIVGVYLTATFLGSTAYRLRAGGTLVRLLGGNPALALPPIAVAALLPLALSDPRLVRGQSFPLGVALVALGISPVCAGLGFLTPMLVDRWSGGSPSRAGSVYALNIVGCIAGPLLASFVLLPAIGERWAIALLAAPLLAWGALAGAAARPAGDPVRGEVTRRRRAVRWSGRQQAGVVAAVGAAVLIVGVTRDYETKFPRREVRRDATATVIAAGEGMNKQLLVNGYGMTVLTSITKMMAHLPLALLDTPRRSALVVCFGMGTTFRSSLSWGVPTTAVELVPSVADLFPYFHPDAGRVLGMPGARIVVDDGRRYLERTGGIYDMITVDPPPPVEAAGSSLLYSREFFRIARARLAPGGILQHWFPGTDATVASAVARAVRESFPHVRVMKSVKGWGLHFLASDRPIARATPRLLAERMPERAAADLVEWEPGTVPEQHFATVLAQEVPVEAVMGLDPAASALTDDRPVNEYDLLRRLRRRLAR